MLLAGCDSGENGAADGPPERSTLRVGVLPVPDVAPLHLADRQGLFSRAGLDVELVKMDLAGENKVDLDDGPVDVLFDSYVSLLTNYGASGNIRFVSEAYEASPGVTALVVPERSAFRRLPDRKQPKIAVNNLKGLGVLLTSAIMTPLGVRQDDVRWVHMPFQDMGGALERGEVDTAWLIEPFITNLRLSSGIAILADTADGPTADIPLSGYACSARFAEQNPRTLATFRRALVEAQKRAADRAAIERILPSYTGIDPSTAALMSVGSYPPSLTAVKIQRVADLMHTFGLVPTRFRITDLIKAA
ncbi:sulfonate ABC transporter substrate-binding protein [Longimycelium tulufanense]|uniref:Sulfonate ABC transporter substrate-binding protein n=1 Tax=Longimycelium tulufanense TaxID=907463 RepID=A0A8J3FUI0_9PSEU|nr:sulfonate ABC transporter substrate-binding protein [Longimycelium tulufanense]